MRMGGELDLPPASELDEKYSALETEKGPSKWHSDTE